MAASNTLYMTPEESDRVRKNLQDRIRNSEERCGRPRESSDPKTLIQQATSTSLMQDLSVAALGLGAPQESQESMVAYAVGCPYPPCTAKLQDLQPMKLSDLRMETHHRGHVLSLRRVSPVAVLKASSWAVVQRRSSEDVERLELFLHKSKHGQDFLDLGHEFLVKEPYYTLNNQEQPTIRIDHPSDLVISVYSNDPESWRSKKDSDAIRTDKQAAEYKDEGNAALRKENYARAYASYTEGLKLASTDGDANSTLAKDLYRNRSHVSLTLQRFDEARTDALSSLTRGEDDEQKGLDAKAYYRAGSAAYNLGDFEHAKAFFEEQEKLQPGNQSAKLNLRRLKVRMEEKATGAHDLNKIVASLSKNKGRPDVASFNGPLELRESAGAGRGLFATRDIEPREVVMLEKAFCLAWSHEPDSFSALTCDVRDDAAIRVFPAGLHKAVVQKLLSNPSQIEKVLDLFGDYKGLGSKLYELDGSVVVDTFQIHDIVQRNAFGAGNQIENEDVSNASTGLWVRASHINHSCVSNAKTSFLGDLMIIRATRRIAAGEEVTHGYDESSDYDIRTAALKRTWGFKCRCALCAAEEADGSTVRKKRRELEDEAKAFIQKQKESGVRSGSVSKAKRLRQALNDTYNNGRYKGLPRRALLEIDQWVQAATSRYLS